LTLLHGFVANKLIYLD